MSTIAINPVNRVVRFYEAPIGKKVIMAFTGVILFGYVVAHLLGNLQIYSARTAKQINTTPPSCTIRPTPGCCGSRALFLLVGRGAAHRRLRPALEAEAATRARSPT